MNLRGWLQHVFCPLHVYCRLKDMGCSDVTANKWAFRYERLIYRRVLG